MNTYVKRAKSGSSGSGTKRTKGDDEEDNASHGGGPAKKQRKKKAVGLQPPYRLSPELATLVGKTILPRPQVISALWEYIKEKGLQVCSSQRPCLLRK